jgi:hypothetical protein
MTTTSSPTTGRAVKHPTPSPLKQNQPGWTLQKIWHKYPVAVVLSAILVPGCAISLWLGRPQSQQVEVTAVNHGEVPPAPTNPVEDSRVIAQQLRAQYEQTMRTMHARLQSDIGNAIAQRANDYFEYARSVEQADRRKAQQENRNPSFDGTAGVLTHLLEVKRQELIVARQAQKPEEVNKILVETYACMVALEAAFNPASVKPFQIQTTVDISDPTRRFSAIITAQAVQGLVNDVRASGESAKQAYEAAIAAQQKASQQSHVSPPTAQPVSFESGGMP